MQVSGGLAGVRQDGALYPAVSTEWHHQRQPAGPLDGARSQRYGDHFSWTFAQTNSEYREWVHGTEACFHHPMISIDRSL